MPPWRTLPRRLSLFDRKAGGNRKPETGKRKADSRRRRAMLTPPPQKTPEILLAHSERFQRRLVDCGGGLEAQGALISGQRLLGQRADQAVHFSPI